MTTPELIKALQRLKVQTGSLACLGCGWEHSCTTKGCAILREAEEMLRTMHLKELRKELLDDDNT